MQKVVRSSLKLCPGRGILLSLVTAIICEKLQMHIYIEREREICRHVSLYTCFHLHVHALKYYIIHMFRLSNVF